ncbi:unnamed protein product [Calypogeia fissa]
METSSRQSSSFERVDGDIGDSKDVLLLNGISLQSAQFAFASLHFARMSRRLWNNIWQSISGIGIGITE